MAAIFYIESLTFFVLVSVDDGFMLLISGLSRGRGGNERVGVQRSRLPRHVGEEGFGHHHLAPGPVTNNVVDGYFLKTLDGNV